VRDGPFAGISRLYNETVGLATDPHMARVFHSVHGGSAANVLKGLGNLALQQRSARFMGMVGLDDAGR